MPKIKFVFFGTDSVADRGLAYLKSYGLEPALVVDKKVDIEIESKIKELSCEFAVLISYGKIVPKRVIEIFPKGILNVHPSLLPKLRGPSPIKSAIMEGLEKTGASIMFLDQEMDHGPILAQREISVSPKSASDQELGRALLQAGASLISEILPDYLSGKLAPVAQDHSQATFTRKFSAADAFIENRLILSQSRLGEVTIAERKVRALNPEPGTYTEVKVKSQNLKVKIVRLKILAAKIENGKLVPTIVQPAGKKPMDWQSFLRGNRVN